MAKGPLRIALERMAFDNLTPSGGPGWWNRVTARHKEWGDAMSELQRVSPSVYGGQFIVYQFSGILYTLTGWKYLIDDVRKTISKLKGSSPSQEFADLLRGVFSQPGAREIAEVIGTAVTEPILSLFEQYAGKDDRDPKEFARAFHGLIVTLSTSGTLADMLSETLSIGQIDAIGRGMQSVYWSLGLGFLGWQTLAPLLSSGLQPGLERYYNRLYRPMRFSASDLRDLYALGEITQADIRREAANIGWREGDIDQWIKLAFRTLGQGDIFKAYNTGLITQDEAVRRLRATGIDPDDIPLLFKLNPKKETDEAKDFSISTARSGFQQGIIPESELRAILKELNYSQREADIVISLEKAKKETDRRSLTISQIKSAWGENVITDSEVVHWLSEIGFSQGEIDLLLETWKAEIEPVFRKLNTGTITAAYVEGILTREQASLKLRDIGLSSDDASLELDLAEARNPDAFGRATPPPAKQLTPGILSDLVSTGLITPGQMADRLREIGYSDEDANLLAETARLRMLPKAKTLSQDTIERAYIAGVLNLEQSSSALTQSGFSVEQAAVILSTVERENPTIFSQTPEERNKQLTPGTLESLLVAGLITADEMTNRLLQLGYSDVDTELLVNRAVQLATPPPRVLNPSLIQRAYLVGVLTREQAYSRLVSLDFTPDDANNFLTTVERENPAVFNPGAIQSTRLPSIQTLVSALQDGIITEEEYYARAQELGFSVNDARLYLSLAVNNERKSVKQLSASQITNAYKIDLFTWGDALNRLLQLGYNNDDATILLKLEKKQETDTDVWGQMLAGRLGPFDAIAQLLNDGYTDKEILAAFQKLSPDILSKLGIDLEQLAGALAEIPGG